MRHRCRIRFGYGLLLLRIHLGLGGFGPCISLLLTGIELLLHRFLIGFDPRLVDFGTRVGLLDCFPRLLVHFLLVVVDRFRRRVLGIFDGRLLLVAPPERTAASTMMMYFVFFMVL
jgi:hypothetical protein